MTVLRVHRIETRPHSKIAVLFGRDPKGRSVYTVLGREDAFFYASLLAEGRGVDLDVPSWKVSEVPR